MTAPTDAERARRPGWSMTAPTDAERVAQIVRRVFPLKIAIGPCAIDCATAEEADEMESRLRSTISAALAAVRTEEREAERERCIVRARDAIACPHCADHEDTCMSREEMEKRIADAIRRKL